MAATRYKIAASPGYWAGSIWKTFHISINNKKKSTLGGAESGRGGEVVPGVLGGFNAFTEALKTPSVKLQFGLRPNEGVIRIVYDSSLY
jgi:hypothetical protein